MRRVSFSHRPNAQQISRSQRACDEEPSFNVRARELAVGDCGLAPKSRWRLMSFMCRAILGSRELPSVGERSICFNACVISAIQPSILRSRVLITSVAMTNEGLTIRVQVLEERLAKLAGALIVLLDAIDNGSEKIAAAAIRELLSPDLETDAS